MLKTVTIFLLNLSLFIQVCLVSGGHPLGYSSNGESEKGPPPSMRKPLGFLDYLRNVGDVVLHRHIRAAEEEVTTEAPEEEKDVWAKLSEFYSDKNNMAMFLVLPLIVLVYGGCSVIYCVAKCRRYMRRQHQKKLKEDRIHLNSDDKNDLNQETNDEEVPSFGAKQIYPTPLSTPNFTSSVVNVNYEADRESSGTPLPSQVPDNENVPPRVITPVKAIVIDPHNKLDSRMSHKEVDASRRTYQDILASRENKIQENQEDNDSLSFVEKLGMPMENHNNAILLNHKRNREFTPPVSSGRESTMSYKEELMAKYDALSTFAMAKKAANILRMDKTKESDPFSRKPRKKIIFIAE